ncbi:MAG: 2-hydroxyacyl-CoA dehydratase [Desulfarculus sp.]|nr:2-hydroxyacyl-CoA dehydratase [Desulfarculus sp.]
MADQSRKTAPSRPLLGLTTTIPVEVALAAGFEPVDLNNRFISDPLPAGLVAQAEELGLPATLCAWIKGIYAWCLQHPEVATIVGVTQGDCSNTHALMELLTLASRRVLAFEYPHGRGAQDLARHLTGLAEQLGTNLEAAEQARRGLLPLRRDLARLDELTWQTGQVSGGENHLWLVSASDFEGDAQGFHARLRAFLREAEVRPPRTGGPRLGLLGVPPIMSGLHETLEDMGATVVFNEVPRQFAMLPPPEGGDASLVAQYLRYTYPYDVFHRLADIQRQIELRRLDGLIHYTQTFCFRQMQDLALRQGLDLPMLTLEGDRVAPVDARTRLRLEAFLEVLS